MCLTCSVVVAPSAKHMLIPVSSATSPGRCAASASTAPAAARVKNACSSIDPAYRDVTTPRAARGRAGVSVVPPAGSPAPATASGAGPGSGPGPGAASAAASGAGSVNRGSAGSRPGSPPGAGAGSRSPRPRLTVVCAIPGRRPISASRTPSARHCRACSHCSAVTFPGVPRRSCMTSAAGPSRFAALCSVATQASLSPSTAATARPLNPSCRSPHSAMFRVTTSPAA
jgi:hypothetical protein